MYLLRIPLFSLHNKSTATWRNFDNSFPQEFFSAPFIEQLHTVVCYTMSNSTLSFKCWYSCYLRSTAYLYSTASPYLYFSLIYFILLSPVYTNYGILYCPSTLSFLIVQEVGNCFTCVTDKLTSK